ncbi:MAG: RNA 2',3'-cyclic phosphodiesterase [Thermaerobacter sp.]|nr:RNA 2',3'-cyclic phosphodiesterase [Thermaerobacter sp.]
MTETRRLFLALYAPPFPLELEQRIDAALRGIPGARRTGEAARHITLAFLGDVEDGRIAAVKAAARETAHAFAQIPYAFDRLGGFPGRGARILAVVGPTPPALAALSLDLARRLRAIGVPSDEKPLRLHLTVGRLRAPAVLPLQPIQEVLGQAEEIHLYESELLSAGAHYTVLETWPLSTALHVDPGPESGEGGD